MALATREKLQGCSGGRPRGRGSRRRSVVGGGEAVVVGDERWSWCIGWQAKQSRGEQSRAEQRSAVQSRAEQSRAEHGHRHGHGHGDGHGHAEGQGQGSGTGRRNRTQTRTRTWALTRTWARTRRRRRRGRINGGCLVWSFTLWWRIAWWHSAWGRGGAPLQCFFFVLFCFFACSLPFACFLSLSLALALLDLSVRFFLYFILLLFSFFL